MQIHLSKPGGQREGPFTVEEINRDLAARRYGDNDYWAWYEGLNSWVPLHSVPGVRAPTSSTANEPTDSAPKVEEPKANEEECEAPGIFEKETLEMSGEGSQQEDESLGEAQPATARDETPTRPAEADDYAPEPEEEPSVAGEHGFTAEDQETEVFEERVSIQTAIAEREREASEPEPEESRTENIEQDEQPAETEEQEAAAPSAELSAPTTVRESKVFSGLPADALEQIFVFTSGEGPSIRQSGVVAMMMLEMVGEDPDSLRQRVPRDVFGQCTVGERIRHDGKVPGAAWRAMSALRPELVERAKAGEYRTCVRTFTTEADDLVAIFLFYNKAKLKA